MESNKLRAWLRSIDNRMISCRSLQNSFVYAVLWLTIDNPVFQSSNAPTIYYSSQSFELQHRVSVVKSALVHELHV
jgi:hypothetical protein